MDKSDILKRKSDHIKLAQRAQIVSNSSESRFYYEPLFSSHPKTIDWDIQFLNKKMRAPLWISSMTGGVGEARHINTNLAKVAAEFGLGMGLGSIRPLLESDEYFEDFNLRKYIGDDLPFYANLGIAQVDELLRTKSISKLHDVVESLKVDGLIIHINLLQEWYQDKGDVVVRSPLEILQEFLEYAHYPVIVKEVGQGFGPKSLAALMNLPLACIDFAAFGGTNFPKLEDLRHTKRQDCDSLISIGHTANEMSDFVLEILKNKNENYLCKQFIVSGGIQSFLDGYYFVKKLEPFAIYGQAMSFLSHADGDYEQLRKYVCGQLEGLAMAKSFLRLKNESEGSLE